MKSKRAIGLLVAFLTLSAGVSCSSSNSSSNRPSGNTASGGGAGAGGGVSSSGGTTETQSSGGSGNSGGGITFAGSTAVATCTPDVGAYCGDGMVNGAETCDDGNALPGDGCTGLCVSEPNFACPPQGGKCVSTLKCGDGKRSPGEACDDGNTTSGDGCASDCNTLESGWYCPTPGQPCMRSSGVCGDSRVQPGETCDDGNTADGDGCSKTCRVEMGFRCTQPGQRCQLVPVCGNGSLEGSEECDDSNMTSADGCSSTCRIEPGYLCATPGQRCRATVCGDGKREGSECCDDGNKLALDGCTADCRCEPECPTSGACTARCGNGIIEASEQCDDGNTASNDGCSATCQTEKGFTCAVPPCKMVNGQCALTVPVVFRDFNAHASANGHPDFQPGFQSTGVALGLVQTTWDSNQKPVLSSTASEANGYMHGQDAFRQWYRSQGEPGGDGSKASKPIAGSIMLWQRAAGGFVNRWGAAGEPWLGPAVYANILYGGPGGGGCTACTVSATGACFDPCVPWGAGNKDACCAERTQTAYDGNPLFFPIDPPATGILTDTRLEAKVPEQYGWIGWPWEATAATTLGITKAIQTATAPFPSATHNFSFTTEVRWWFRYDSSATMRLDFTGDDDVWVFVNGKLAVDLGGWHVPLDGSVTISAATAGKYGLENGSVYTIGIFHAERQSEGSTFKLTLSGFGLEPSKCVPTCGDGVVTVNEECDAGSANSDSACGACRPDCTFGPRCGDSTTQQDCGEECDDGVNIGGYNQCGAGCKLAERCGDGVTQQAFGEQCDDGPANGQSGHCTTGCGVPGFCGDGVVQAPEECDNGINDNSYGGCSSDCHFGPRCGDGVVQADGGEACDLGAQNQDGVYGGCTTRCTAGPHCGDGIVQASEQCDPGSSSTSTMSSTSSNGCSAANSTCSDTCRLAPIR